MKDIFVSSKSHCLETDMAANEMITLFQYISIGLCKVTDLCYNEC